MFFQVDGRFQVAWVRHGGRLPENPFL